MSESDLQVKEFNEKWQMHKVVQEAITNAHVNPSPQTMKMFDELKSVQQGVRTAVSGKGRGKKTKAVAKIRQSITNYQQTEMNKEAKFLIKNVIRQKCGTIHMEDLTNITKDKNNLYFKTWPYYKLQQAIEAQANKY